MTTPTQPVHELRAKVFLHEDFENFTQLTSEIIIMMFLQSCSVCIRIKTAYVDLKRHKQNFYKKHFSGA